MRPPLDTPRGDAEGLPQVQGVPVPRSGLERKGEGVTRHDELVLPTRDEPIYRLELYRGPVDEDGLLVLKAVVGEVDLPALMALLYPQPVAKRKHTKKQAAAT